MNKPKNWLTINELQIYVRLFKRHWSRTHIQSLIKLKKLKSFKIGSARLFLKSDVTAYLKSLKRKAPEILYKKSLDK